MEHDAEYLAKQLESVKTLTLGALNGMKAAMGEGMSEADLFLASIEVVARFVLILTAEGYPVEMLREAVVGALPPPMPKSSGKVH